MSKVKLNQTAFDVVPLKNVVGVGNSTAYQISVIRGKLLGDMGQLNELTSRPAINDSNFSHYRNEAADEGRSWFRRALAQ